MHEHVEHVERCEALYAPIPLTFTTTGPAHPRHLDALLPVPHVDGPHWHSFVCPGAGSPPKFSAWHAKGPSMSFQSDHRLLAARPKRAYGDVELQWHMFDSPSRAQMGPSSICSLPSQPCPATAAQRTVTDTPQVCAVSWRCVTSGERNVKESTSMEPFVTPPVSASLIW